MAPNNQIRRFYRDAYILARQSSYTPPTYGQYGYYSARPLSSSTPTGTAGIPLNVTSFTDHEGDLTVNTNDVIDKVRVHNGRIVIASGAYNWTISRCDVAGYDSTLAKTDAGGDQWLIDCRLGTSGPNGDKPGVIMDTEVHNERFPHYSVNGIGGANWVSYRTWIHDVVDGADVFWIGHNNELFIADAYGTVFAAHSLTPDPNHLADTGGVPPGGTHSDPVQIPMGSFKGVGCFFDGIKGASSNRTSAWDPSVTGSAINVTQNVAAARGLWIEKSEFRGGQQNFTVTVQNGGVGNVGSFFDNVMDLSNCPSLNKNGATKKRNVVYDSGFTFTRFDGNTQPDGSAIVVESYAGAA